MEGSADPSLSPLPPSGAVDKLSPEVIARLKTAAALLRKAEKPVRVLRAVARGPEVAEAFFAAGEKELPKAAYTPLDAAPVHETLKAARAMIDPGPEGGRGPVQAWLLRIADFIGTGADMLAAIGTKEFHRQSVKLYGSPQADLLNCDVRPLDLARMLDYVLGSFNNLEINLDKTEVVTSAEDLAERMAKVLGRHFGDSAPKIEIVDHLPSNALAGARYIRLKRSAQFSDRDLAQLVQHEAFVHIATSLNGSAQSAFPILAAGHPGTTRTQEGLAVFAELISGAMDPSRLMRLADRVLAIQRERAAHYAGRPSDRRRAVHQRLGLSGRPRARAQLPAHRRAASPRRYHPSAVRRQDGHRGHAGHHHAGGPRPLRFPEIHATLGPGLALCAVLYRLLVVPQPHEPGARARQL